MPTGILGLDEALGGGLPRGRTTLVVGSTGSGKTIFALQVLSEGVRRGEAGVLVTFEEGPDDIRANVDGFTWAPSGRESGRLAIMDGRVVRTAFHNGSFDLVGLLSAVEYRCRRLSARRIALDGLDVLLEMIDDPAVMRREVYRLADWLTERGLTAIITAKKRMDDEDLPSRYAFLPFLTDCVIVLHHRVVGRTAVRGLRILKCRGLAHSSNELPMILSSSGLTVIAPRTAHTKRRLSSERISSGIARLDTMLDGGYLRGTCTLVSGSPGTSKTSLAGAFAEAACLRGERTLFVSFEETGEGVVRNLASVNIKLGRFVRRGLLRMVFLSARSRTPEELAFSISELAGEHKARCLVVDPISALVHLGAGELAGEAVLGLLAFTRSHGISVFLTSLLAASDPSEESTAIGSWTSADTWMRLSYVAAAGERNRALTIVKSRGTAHSNQVRELILSRRGLSLVDVYTAGGAVLMGTLRREKEDQERADHTRKARAEEARYGEIAAAIAETQTRVASLRSDEDRKKEELRLLKESSLARAAVGATNLALVRQLRGADVPQKKIRPSAVRPVARRKKS
jgi:circadian clock protein KaiC